MGPRWGTGSQRGASHQSETRPSSRGDRGACDRGFRDLAEEPEASGPQSWERGLNPGTGERRPPPSSFIGVPAKFAYGPAQGHLVTLDGQQDHLCLPGPQVLVCPLRGDSLPRWHAEDPSHPGVPVPPGPCSHRLQLQLRFKSPVSLSPGGPLRGLGLPGSREALRACFLLQTAFAAGTQRVR